MVRKRPTGYTRIGDPLLSRMGWPKLAVAFPDNGLSALSRTVSKASAEERPSGAVRYTSCRVGGLACSLKVFVDNKDCWLVGSMSLPQRKRCKVKTWLQKQKIC